ncbi:mannose-1-phosphate guanylyltransferase/mannose-6-phosphate isomerase [Robiginitomaculum antarcticum]|uniref:mannose-1-phosphate guanylyltransferase/mannose-6-phosphate isomerase n=1 Tax=Robiginitomaculum antarcticum TaxID=437507 RepID=UPI000363131A|nr:mannose-1-phosphate guanylyltransferase/mannose-6-phosphate isomerase [Robiginitomaculum antarcticum]
MIKIIPVIMSGGSGTRLWPASRKKAPKQLLSLVSEHTMIQDTALRLAGDFPDGTFLAPMIICNAAHGKEISQQLIDVGLPPSKVIVEPVGRNTAPCAAVAALAAAQIDPDALILLAPADHHIQDTEALHRAVSAAAEIAQNDYLVTFGITPSRAETGYGYIQQGLALGNSGFTVKAFKEKPDLATAEQYIAGADYFWNAGIFLFKPENLLREMRAFCPDILSACETAYSEAALDNSGWVLDEDAFSACPSDSIDYAIMERTARAAVVPADIGWSDIGSWRALWERGKDSRGNAIKGPVNAIDTVNTLIHTDGAYVATLGLENMVVVVQDGAVLVSHMDRVQDVKKVVDDLKRRQKSEFL